MYVFMAIPLLFQRQKMFIVCGALCPKLCHLPKEEPPFRGEGRGELKNHLLVLEPEELVLF